MIKIHTIDLSFLGLKEAIASFLIETSNGPILIETGPHSTFQNLSKEIEKLGFSINEIKHVFLTHIHLDHAGAAWAFAEKGAKVYLHPFGARHMADPSKLMASAKMIYQEKMDELWGEMKRIPENQLIQVKHEEVIEIGSLKIKSLHTPGHASHHIAWQIDDVIFTGDVAGVKIEKGPVQPPCPPPDISIEKWLDSIKIIKKEKPSKLYLTHYDAIENVEEHLDELTVMLKDWSEFVKAQWEKGLTNEEIVPLFVAHTRKQLEAAGLGSAEIAQYEAANPSWMSVAGLVRYWTKKSQT